MKLLALAGLTLVSQIAFAQIYLVRDGVIYKTALESNWAPGFEPATELARQPFIVLDKAGETFSFSSDGPNVLPDFNLNKSMNSPKVPKLEGCGRHPLEWLPKSKIVGSLKNKSLKTKIFIQAPTGAKPVKTIPSELPDALAKILAKRWPRDPAYTPADISKLLEASLVFKITGMDLVYTFFEDDLNQSFFILEKPAGSQWQLKHVLTLTDDCP